MVQHRLVTEAGDARDYASNPQEEYAFTGGSMPLSISASAYPSALLAPSAKCRSPGLTLLRLTALRHPVSPAPLVPTQSAGGMPMGHGGGPSPSSVTTGWPPSAQAAPTPCFSPPAASPGYSPLIEGSAYDGIAPVSADTMFSIS